MAAARRQQILEAIQTRLQAIRVGGGYNTDAGLAVYLGESPVLGPDDPDVAIAIVPIDDAVDAQVKGLLIALPVEIEALAKADLAEPWVAVEQILQDIKRAHELEDRTLGGLLSSAFERGTTRSLPRQPGSTTVGAGIGYLCRYKEAWGNP